MAITYHAGRRIQGLSEPTFIDNLSTDKGWTTSNSSFLAYDGSSNELDWLVNQSVSQDNEIYLSVGTLNDEKFVARFQYDVDTATVNDGNLIELFIGMSDSTGVGAQDFIGMYHKYRSTLDQWGAIDDNSTSPLTNINGTDVGNITGNTGTYYCEIIRLSSTTYKITMYTNSDYSGIEWQTSTLTVDAGVTGLQYFKIMTNNNSISSGGNVLSGSVKNIAIANGVTTMPDYDTKPTNVQLSSRYEETNTRKMYSYNEPDFNKTDCVGYYTLDEASGNPTNHVTTANGFTDIPTETIYYLKHGHDSTGTHWVKKVGSTVTTITQAEWNALSGAITESHKGNQTGALPSAWSGMWQGSTSSINGHGWYAISFSTDTNSPANGSSGATQNVTGKFGKCFEFSGGNNEQVGLNGTMIADTTNDQTADFTISCWVNHDNDNGNYPMLVSNYAGSNTGGFQFYINGTANTVTFWTSTNNVTASGALSSGSWHHVVCVRESGTVKFYINGSLNSSTISNTHYIEGLVDCAIGGKTDGGNGLNGKIDEVSIWRRALSASEISALYNSGTGKTLLEAKQAKEWQEIGT